MAEHVFEFFGELLEPAGEIIALGFAPARSRGGSQAVRWLASSARSGVCRVTRT